MNDSRLQHEIQAKVQEHLLPLFSRYAMDTEDLESVLKWKPIVLILGNYSSGKSTLVSCRPEKCSPLTPAPCCTSCPRRPWNRWTPPISTAGSPPCGSWGPEIDTAADLHANPFPLRSRFRFRWRDPDPAKVGPISPSAPSLQLSALSFVLSRLYTASITTR